MTYCIAFTVGNDAYLFSDSALTTSTPVPRSQGTYGQPHELTPNGYFTERALKLGILSAEIAVAYSGNVYLAGNILKQLQELSPCPQSLRDSLSTISRSIAPVPENESVDLLFAISAVEGPQIGRWSTENNLLELNPNCIASIGSMPNFFNDLVFNTLQLRVQRGIAREYILAYSLGLIQSQVITENLRDHGIGGQFTGLRMGPDGPKWQDDTFFVIYDERDLSNLFIVQAIVRENILSVHSNVTQEIACYASILDAEKFIEWSERVLPHLRSTFLSDAFPVWIFMSSSKKLTTVIYRADLTKECDLVKASFAKEGKLVLSISQKFMDDLTRSIVVEHSNQYPAHLRFITD